MLPGTHWHGLSLDERRQFAEWATQDASRCNYRYPGLREPCLWLDEANLYRAVLYSDRRQIRVIKMNVNETLTDPEISETPHRGPVGDLHTTSAQGTSFSGVRRRTRGATTTIPFGEPRETAMVLESSSIS